jgi:ribosomal protein S18 acetylase RimI-like enzyme
MKIKIKKTKNIPKNQLLEIYRLNEWSSSEKPDLLYNALTNSDTLISAWVNDKMVGVANAISDGHLVVYYPHIIVHPDYQGKGIGIRMLEVMKSIYNDFHQQMVVAESHAINFYEKLGFVKAGNTKSMWIYQGNDH